jgi:hypothetical protein
MPLHLAKKKYFIVVKLVLICVVFPHPGISLIPIPLEHEAREIISIFNDGNGD